MNVIEFDHATLRIGGHVILADTSLAIKRGEFIGVLGPNGAGKTTLMRAILGLLRPSTGSISVFGRTPRRGDAAIGYLPQVRTVMPDLRVRGFDFIASSVRGDRWGPPMLWRADRKMTGNRDLLVPGIEAIGLHADRHIDLLAKKYLDKDKYPFAQPGEVRVMYEIEPNSASGMG